MNTPLFSYSLVFGRCRCKACYCLAGMRADKHSVTLLWVYTGLTAVGLEAFSNADGRLTLQLPGPTNRADCPRCGVLIVPETPELCYNAGVDVNLIHREIRLRLSVPVNPVKNFCPVTNLGSAAPSELPTSPDAWRFYFRCLKNLPSTRTTLNPVPQCR